MSETETETPEAPNGEEDVPDPKPCEEEPAEDLPPVQGAEPNPVEPRLNIEEFALLENLPGHITAALARWIRTQSLRGAYATAGEWRSYLETMRTHTPH